MEPGAKFSRQLIILQAERTKWILVEVKKFNPVLLPGLINVYPALVRNLLPDLATGGVGPKQNKKLLNVNGAYERIRNSHHEKVPVKICLIAQVNVE